MANAHANRRSVKATNINTQEQILFRSMSAAGKQLGINAGTIKMVCEGINHCKTGISKLDGQRYKVEYVLVQVYFLYFFTASPNSSIFCLICLLILSFLFCFL